jgi:hypothetical protein
LTLKTPSVAPTLEELASGVIGGALDGAGGISGLAAGLAGLIVQEKLSDTESAEPSLAFTLTVYVAGDAMTVPPITHSEVSFKPAGKPLITQVTGSFSASLTEIVRGAMVAELAEP